MAAAPLATMATALAKIAEDMQQLSVGQSEASQRMESMEASQQNLAAAQQNLAAQVQSQSMVWQGQTTAITKPEDWALGDMPHVDNTQVTGAQVAEMIHAALLNKVAPALGAAFKAVDTRCNSSENRITAVEQELAKMK